LRIEERAGERLIMISGTVIVTLEMKACKECGLFFVPEALQEHVDKQIEAPKEAFYSNLCPQCRRTAQAAKMVGGWAGFFK
jgi:hypothetical protein